MARKQWVDPRKRYRICWVKGCDDYGKRIEVSDDYVEGSHHARTHPDAPLEAMTLPSDIESGRAARLAARAS